MELLASISDLNDRLLAAANAMDRVKTALDLPFRPAVFDPVHETWRGTSGILGGVNRLIRERDLAIAERDEALRKLAGITNAD